jgi:hypothetical protein
VHEDSPASRPDGGIGSHAFAPTVAVGHAQIDWSSTLERCVVPPGEMPYAVAVAGGDRVVRSAKGSVRANPEVGAAYERQRTGLQRVKAENDQLEISILSPISASMIVPSTDARQQKCRAAPVLIEAESDGDCLIEIESTRVLAHHSPRDYAKHSRKDEPSFVKVSVRCRTPLRIALPAQSRRLCTP